MKFVFEMNFETEQKKSTPFDFRVVLVTQNEKEKAKKEK